MPGPEEKRIVGVPVPIADERNPYVNMNPVILPLPENNPSSEANPECGQCEPIIEEPATPEQQHTEALESDIEDLYGEDPNEIPEIDFNKEVFTKTIQLYMREQEGDMSKAIVALTSRSASIPTQKLKHVSRLRTEHQV